MLKQITNICSQIFRLIKIELFYIKFDNKLHQIQCTQPSAPFTVCNILRVRTFYSTREYSTLFAITLQRSVYDAILA